MKRKIETNYALFDRQEILLNLFHPRRDWGDPGKNSDERDIFIPVEGDIVVGARKHFISKNAPTLLFFHGNGEIVSDYDEIAPYYNRNGMNFFPVDYRGYGRSTGNPTVSAMMADAHRIFQFVEDHLCQENITGPLIAMGRSLGSASALELALHYQDQLDGLIIESGFAFVSPLLRLLGVDTAVLGLDESSGLENVLRIKAFRKPTLIIHAENDHIIPFSDGQTLYDASPAKEKRLLMIPGANHNDILARGLPEYMKAILKFAENLKS